jgi:hypothetical protein
MSPGDRDPAKRIEKSSCPMNCPRSGPDSLLYSVRRQIVSDFWIVFRRDGSLSHLRLGRWTLRTF